MEWVNYSHVRGGPAASRPFAYHKTQGKILPNDLRIFIHTTESTLHSVSLRVIEWESTVMSRCYKWCLGRWLGTGEGPLMKCQVRVECRQYYWRSWISIMCASAINTPLDKSKLQLHRTFSTSPRAVSHCWCLRANLTYHQRVVKSG